MQHCVCNIPWRKTRETGTRKGPQKAWENVLTRQSKAKAKAKNLIILYFHRVITLNFIRNS